jgi:hypothetical protein
VAVPGAHLLRAKRGDETTLPVEKLVTLAASVAQLRRPALACCKEKALLGVAKVMHDGHWIMKLVNVTIADGIASSQSHAQGGQRTSNRNAHRSNENKMSHAAERAGGCKLRVELQTSS